MPRKLQSKIHSEKSIVAQMWSDYKEQIIDLYNASQNKSDFNDHLIREFNRKINRFNESSDLFFTPYDAGFRFTGDSTLLTNLFAHWKLDEPTGLSNRIDSGPNGFHLTTSNSLLSVAGKIGTAVQSNLNTYKLSNSTLNLAGLSGFTISAWIFHADAEADVLQEIMGIWSSANPLTSQFILTFGGLGQYEETGYSTFGVSLFINGGEVKTVFFEDPIVTQAWHLYVVRFDSTNGTLSIKVDNGGWTSVATPNLPVANPASPVPFSLLNAGDNIGLVEPIDSVSIWERPLIDAEVNQLWNNGNGRTP